MVKLYYTATSSGAAAFISAFTAELHIQCEEVDLQKHVTASGEDFYAINPKGNVPCLVLNDGTVLNENSSVLQYIADQAPTNMLAPPNSSMARYVLQNVLSYIGSEVQTNMAAVLHPQGHNHSGEIRAWYMCNVHKKMEYLENHLIGEKQYLVGDSFTIADSYLFIVLTWSGLIGLDLTAFPRVKDYLHRMENLENVKGAIACMASHPHTTSTDNGEPRK